MKSKIISFVLLSMLMFGETSGYAQILGEEISIHGFGSWAYGRTNNKNRYLMGTKNGNYEYLDFSLNISADPYENLSLYIQPAFSETWLGREVGLDYAFAEWFFSDMMTVRIGKVKAPSMLYTEVYDVGTTRPFFSLPQGVYHELAAEAYKGIGFTGRVYHESGWGVQYDIYGGSMSLYPNPMIESSPPAFAVYTPVLKDIIGGRFNIQTPFDGLSFSVSSAAGDMTAHRDDIAIEDHPLNDWYLLFGVSTAYRSDRWWLRSEYITQQESPKIQLNILYAEAAYTFTEHWQVAARYEVVDAEVNAPELMNIIVLDSQTEHEEVALGLNYWFNPNLVFKCSYHFVKGNRFAFPEKAEDYIAGVIQGSLEEETQLMLFGVQFSF